MRHQKPCTGRSGAEIFRARAQTSDIRTDATGLQAAWVACRAMWNVDLHNGREQLDLMRSPIDECGRRGPLLTSCMPQQWKGTSHEPPADFLAACVHIVHYLSCSPSSMAGLSWMTQRHLAVPSRTYAHTFIRLDADPSKLEQVPAGWCELIPRGAGEPYIDAMVLVDRGAELVMATPVGATMFGHPFVGPHVRGYSFRRARLIVTRDQLFAQGGMRPASDIEFCDDMEFVHVAPTAPPPVALAPQRAVSSRDERPSGSMPVSAGTSRSGGAGPSEAGPACGSPSWTKRRSGGQGGGQGSKAPAAWAPAKPLFKNKIVL
jgi:hypothetical protein